MLDPIKCPHLLTPQGSRLSSFNNNKDLPSNYSKKRIGCYSYHLNDCIGSGYSSQVFKGCKNDNKQIKYAIKVIKLAKMSKGNYQLLQNEIKILKELDHPNIIKMHDVFYTENNCYIITQYCEGGTLQSNLEGNKNLDWKTIFNQLLDACQYLEKKLIIHRDIKPANIFQRNNVWKIGDFGFARYLPYKTAQIKEMYMIGSPLYMPPQTLSANIYSLKTDSFAFGILLFHLITKKFPWSGNNRKQLLQSYTTKKYPIEKITYLPCYFQNFLKGLCEIEISRRYFITDFGEIKGMQSNVSQTTHTTRSSNAYEDQELIAEVGQDINLDIVQRMKISKFVAYININIEHLPEMNKVSESLKRFLKFLCIIFGWYENESFTVYLDEFMCSNYRQFSKQEELVEFHSQLQKQVENLNGSLIRRCQILKIKLIQLSDVIRCIVMRDYKNLKYSIGRLVLHVDFSKVLISPAQINQIEQLQNQTL